MNVRTLALACLLPAAPACSVYTTSMRTEHYTDVQRFAAQGFPADARPASDGVVVIRNDGVKLVYPAGTQVTKVAGGIAVDPGAGRPLEAFAADDITAIELHQGRERQVKQRTRSEAGSAAATVGVVVAATAAIIGVGLFCTSDALSFGRIDFPSIGHF